ncbi:MAG: glycoside hydrolase family 43 protein [Verrucomicrobia bacterium]|nr:glycoside hydrolase family 43 protein [Verrucomicrobiota bacterium]
MRYKNPVYGRYFADPFVWRLGNEYFAVGTGREEAGGVDEVAGWVFPLLHSRDLVYWERVGEALERPDPSLGNTYWAPEVAVHGGWHWMYYSIGVGDKRHQIRAAVAGDPLGPYRDVDANPLVAPNDLPFAIDPHPFRDEDGAWYLFYARDFLDSAEGVRAGTALMVDRLERMDRVAGQPHVVVRARHDWQRFMVDRPMYGGVYDWHTLEGPCVVKHDGRYYCFYSAGRWENETYGVDYAVADHVLGPYSDAGNEAGPRVLKTVPGKVLGPGHNSLVKGPDGHDYLAYHAWDPAMSGRRLCIDRLQWTKDGPRSKVTF